jgi:hypothetical protein
MAVSLPKFPFCGELPFSGDSDLLNPMGEYGRIIDTYALHLFGGHGGNPVPCLSSALAAWFKAQIGSA